MVNLLFQIIGLVTELVREVARKAPVFLLIIPVIAMGGQLSSILIVGALAWFFLGGDMNKIKGDLKDILDDYDEEEEEEEEEEEPPKSKKKKK